MGIEGYFPSDVEERGLACLAEAWHLARHLPDAWPDWNATRIPLAVYGRGGGFFLVGHPAPPRRARRVLWPVMTLAGGAGGGRTREGALEAGGSCDGLPQPLFMRGLPAAVNGGAVVVRYHGVPTAFVPVEWAGESAEEAVAYVARLLAEAFRAHLQTACRPDRPDPDMAYPDDHPVNNALGNIEGQLLLEAYHSREGADLSRLALAFALIRRERRAQLDDEQILYEQAREYGLAAYVQFLALEAAARPGYASCRPFRDVYGPDTLSAGDHRARLLASLEAVNRRGNGAGRRRFAFSGMGLALFLDRLSPGWKARLRDEDVWLDTLLEEEVRFDGGAGDDMVIAETENRFGYVQKLEEEREHARKVRQRKQELVDTILRGDGTLFIFDVRDLRLTGSRIEPERVESINERLQVHTGPVEFRYGGTVLSFSGIPVVEDRLSGLLEVCIPNRRLKFLGDGGDMYMPRPAEFTHGFELAVGGVRVIARRGTIQPIEGAVYVKIKQ